MSPGGIAIDGAGNLYGTDNLNCTVRKNALGSVSVSTMIGVVGQGGGQLGALQTQLNRRDGVAVLPSGALISVEENGVR